MAKETTDRTSQGRTRAEIIHFGFLTSALFVFWVILSGKMEAQYLIIGLICSIATAVLTRPLLVLPPERTNSSWLSLWDLPWLRFAVYIPWLLWQLVVANVQVALVILHPKLPIEPQVVRFKKHLPHPVARVLLANSITLTPGTVTMDIDEDEYIVHCLQGAFVGALISEHGEAAMPGRVGAVFGVRREHTPVTRETSGGGL
jgi:multicomponent Na+:H+ antiporter subunit E